jgi:hypothetical protein
MEEGDGMKQDGIIYILMYQNWRCLIKHTYYNQQA